MKEEETVNDYFARVFVVVNHRKMHGERMDPVVIVEKI